VFKSVFNVRVDPVLHKKLYEKALKSGIFEDTSYPFVLLFGSYSEDSESAMSDVDVGIFYKNEIGYQTAMLEDLLGKKVDLIALNDVYKKDPLFGFQILENHTSVLINDEDAYVSFKTSCQLYYLDHKPLIEMQERAFLKRIENDKIGERNFVTEG